MNDTIKIRGYVCRSKRSDQVIVAKGRGTPEIKEETGWYYHVPGWFYSVSVRKFKKTFGFVVKPGTHVFVDISLSIKERIKS